MSIEPLSYIKLLPHTSFAETGLSGDPIRIRLSSNEAALGPSPLAVDAFIHTSGQISRYPDPSAANLRKQLAQRHGLKAAQYVCSTGSENLIHLIITAFASQGDEVVMGQYAFLAGKVATIAHGAKPVIVPDRPDLSHDLDAMLTAITSKTKIVYLPNPNNPTGTSFSKQTLHEFHRALPKNVLLLLDTAYGEYMVEESYSRGFELVEAGAENIVVLGTFSKIYGLASLRVGWAYGNPTIMDYTNRVKAAYAVPGPAQEAAIKALEDTEHLNRERNHVDQWRQWLADRLRDLGISIGAHSGNFVAARFPNGEPQADLVYLHLRKHGTLVKSLKNFGLSDALRISIGTEQEMRTVVRQLTEAIQNRARPLL